MKAEPAMHKPITTHRAFVALVTLTAVGFLALAGLPAKAAEVAPAVQAAPMASASGVSQKPGVAAPAAGPVLRLSDINGKRIYTVAERGDRASRTQRR